MIAEAFNTITYSLLLISSTHKKNFSAIGRFIKKSGRYVARLIQKMESNFALMERIIIEKLGDRKEIFITIDNTLIKKMFSKQIEGTGKWVDTKIRRKIMAFKMYTALFTDGKITLPFHAMFANPDELLPKATESKYDWIKRMIREAQRLFPGKKITLLGDGEFSTIELLRWLKANKIRAEMRMAKSCKVIFNGEAIRISDIKRFTPKGRQMARTIKVEWHGINLHLTSNRLINKNGSERIVYQAATYKAKPAEHIRAYKIRWTIEKLFRTSKQSLGLQDCISTSLEVQLNHATSVLLAYSLLQIECRNQRLDSPEKAIRSLRSKKLDFLQRRFASVHQLSGGVPA
jgi:hypothetical protein